VRRGTLSLGPGVAAGIAGLRGRSTERPRGSPSVRRSVPRFGRVGEWPVVEQTSGEKLGASRTAEGEATSVES